jgi:hypothetical protein
MDSNVVKFPFSVSRRAHSRKPRASKNGTPEERRLGWSPRFSSMRGKRNFCGYGNASTRETA